MKPQRNPRYLAFIRTQPCCVCGATRGIEASHTGPAWPGTEVTRFLSDPALRKKLKKTGAKCGRTFHAISDGRSLRRYSAGTTFPTCRTESLPPRGWLCSVRRQPGCTHSRFASSDPLVDSLVAPLNRICNQHCAWLPQELRGHIYRRADPGGRCVSSSYMPNRLSYIARSRGQPEYMNMHACMTQTRLE
jgi:hypothetical protein